MTLYKGTSDKEAATEISVELLTDFVGSVRYFIHTFQLSVNYVMTEEAQWQLLLK